ncbi:ABC transporter transmembrane domain-containing protein [Phaeobacter sp.]|uniref:ABC transporter transmembrane domain-containing protein n=1 Tax=Phaeobacter sp. TaxID=1902409 RepID=UPI0025D8E6A1|nr:ABC transporter transmembrane domain-containing protein [Phaeobacter sp.]
MEMDEFSGQRNSVAVKVPVWAASLSLNVVALVMPVVILLIFDRVIPFQSVETLQMLTLLLVASAGVEIILRWSRATLLNASAERAAVSNNRRFVQKILAADPQAFAKEAPPAYLDRFSAIGQLRDHHAGQNHALLIDLPFTLVFALMVAVIGGWLVLVPVAGLAAVLLFSLFMKRAQWALFDARKGLDNRRYTFLSEVLSASQTVKANRMERQMTRRFELLEDQTVEISHKLIRFSGLAQSFGAIFGQVSVATMGLLGAYLVIQEFIGIAELAACMLLNGRIVQPLTKLMTLWVQSENLTVSWSKLREIDGLPAVPRGAGVAQPLKGRIDLSDLILTQNSTLGGSAVTGSAAGGAVRMESVTVHPGEVLVIEAQSDWAAQALQDVITGQRPPASGRLRIDGLPAQDRVAQRGRDAIVVLEDDPAILSGTLLENISAFGDAEQVERAKEIAEKLGLERRVHRLPMGYNTALGQGSGFENDPVNRQLIALTRVLALQPRILLMREPTAVLDTRERDALAACLATLEHSPTLVIDSPDPRMKRLATVTAELIDLHQDDINAWEADAKADAHEAQALRKDVA